MKYMIAVALLFMATEPAAQNPFEKLPFGIVVGTSTSKDIRARGVCSNPKDVRCSAYYMLGGKFVVYLSESDVVNKVAFKTVGLPQPWKDLGLKLREEGASTGEVLPDDQRGTSRAEFARILKTLKGVKNLEERETKTDFHGSGTTLSFDVGVHHFDAYFETVKAYRDTYAGGAVIQRPAYDLGLRYIEVTEAY